MNGPNFNQPLSIPDSNIYSSNNLEQKEVNGLSEEKANKKAPPQNHRFTVIFFLTVFTGAFAIIAEIVCLIQEIVKDKIWRPDIAKLEGVVKEKYSKEFVEKLKKIKNLDFQLVIKRLFLSQTHESEIFVLLESNYKISTEQLGEILKGAHVRLDDEGEVYKIWEEKVKEKQKRTSSHPSDDHQYSVKGTLIRELLFSKISENKKTYTWFQLENHPVYYGYIIRHMLDFFKYKLTRKNQGPCGSSPYTHDSPIILKRKKS